MAATPRKLVHVEMIIPHTASYDAMVFAEGLAIAGTFHMRPVKHGGETEEGTLMPQPRAKEIVLAYAREHPAFKISDVIRANKEMSRNTIYTAVKTLKVEKVLKQTSPGHYLLAGTKTKVTKASTKPKTKRPPPGSPDTLVVRVLETVRRLQNGTGNGVHVQDIKAALPNVNKQSIAPTIADLMDKKLVKRTEPAHYRAVD